MKITKSELRNIIKEEIQLLNERGGISNSMQNMIEKKIKPVLGNDAGWLWSDVDGFGSDKVYIDVFGVEDADNCIFVVEEDKKYYVSVGDRYGSTIHDPEEVPLSKLVNLVYTLAKKYKNKLT